MTNIKDDTRYLKRVNTLLGEAIKRTFKPENKCKEIKKLLEALLEDNEKARETGTSYAEEVSLALKTIINEL